MITPQWRRLSNEDRVHLRESQVERAAVNGDDIEQDKPGSFINPATSVNSGPLCTVAITLVSAIRQSISFSCPTMPQHHEFCPLPVDFHERRARE
jgi:hypothetical protein